MEEMRQKAGAQNYHGHDYMDLQRFAENTRHMIIFDVLTHDSPVGWKGERTRLFLSDIGYEKALDSQAKGQIKILSHAKVRNGDLFYDHNGKENAPACFCQISAMKKLWTVRQRGRSRFSAMQRSEMEICFMTTKNRYDRRNLI